MDVDEVASCPTCRTVLDFQVALVDIDKQLLMKRGFSIPLIVILITCFINVSGWLLAVTGLAKMVAILDDGRALDTLDPVFGISFRQLGFLAGLVEVCVAASCICYRRQPINLIAIAWVATVIALYRLFLFFSSWEVPCNCLGSLAGKLPISSHHAEVVTGLLLLFLLTGSYAFLIFLWRQRTRGGMTPMSLFQLD